MHTHNPKAYRTQLAEIEKVLAAGPYGADWPSLESYSAPRWYRDGKFGIFIHWGVYAVPAFGSEWYPRNMYQKGSREYEHHLKTWGPHDKFGYKDFIPKFKAEKFDPAAWAGLFQESGARFVVPVAEHHDGFAMYATDLNRWNAAEMGPRRDLVGEIKREVEARGLTFGASSHRAEHCWFFDGGLSFPSDVQDPAHADLYTALIVKKAHNHDVHGEMPPESFFEDWLVRSCEMVDRLRPKLVFFDWWIEQRAFQPWTRKFAAFYYNRGRQWGHEVAINYKYQAFPYGSAVFDIERGQLRDVYPLPWQNDTSIAKNSWGYTENQQWKSANGLIADLIDVVSKNGQLLLNIGPRADGTIPEEEAKVLRDIGAWLHVNGEAIYGTRPWTKYGEGPTDVPEGAFSDTKRSAFLSADIRFTRKGDTLYAMPLARPHDGVVKIRTLAAGAKHAPRSIAKVELLGHGELPFHQDHEGLTVTLLEKKASDLPCAFKITGPHPL